MTKVTRRNLGKGLLFISPWVVGFLVFMLYPIGASLYYGFCDYSVLKPPLWIGTWNYEDLVKDEVFWTSLWNTVIFAAFALPLGLIVSLTVALLLNTGVRGLPVYRTLFFLPSLVPLVALAVLWMWIFNGKHGILNHLLKHIGIDGPGWLSTTVWAKPALILMSVWGVGHAMVIYLAGLQDVPQSLYESADLDGANAFQKIWHITLPLISPVIYFNLVMGIIGTFQIFAVPYVMTGGGPARATTFYAMYLYNLAFEDLRMGYASAMAWILFLIILGLTLLATRFSRTFIHYER